MPPDNTANDDRDNNEPPQSSPQEQHHPSTSDEACSPPITPNDRVILPLLLRAIRNPDQLTAMISNYSTSYNAVNVGIVLPVLNYAAAAPQDPAENAAVASSLLAGMIAGQLLGGCLGDVVGRRNAMLLVMLLQIGASAGGALFIETDHDDADVGRTTLEQLALWRLILGIGAGGVYPLAAVMSAENEREGGERRSDDDDGRGYEAADLDEENDARANDSSSDDGDILSFQRVALTFSMQGLGFVTVPLLAYPLLALRVQIDLVWRLILGLGAVPGLVVLYLRLFRKKQRNEQGTDKNGTVEKSDDPLLHGKSEGGSLELTPPTSDEDYRDGVHNNDGADVTFQSTVSELFHEIVDGDPSVHITQQDHQLALVDNSHLDNGNYEHERFHDEHDASTSSTTHQTTSLWSSIKNEPHLAKKLAGTAGTWFLFDALFYGNTLFQPVVLEAAFGSKDNVEDGYALLLLTVRDSLMISMLSLPGYFVTVILIGRRMCVCRSLRSRSTPTRCSGLWMCSPCTQTPAYIQMQGFLVMFLLYLLIGLYWTLLSSIQWLLLVLYAGTFFFANYGPNSTTFLLPSVTYSKECRSTLNGMSAAAGKLGALVGATVFEPAANKWGANIVMAACAVVSLVGLTFTKMCVGGYENVGRVHR